MFKFFCQQQLGGQGEGHQQHGHVGRAQALLGHPHQAAAPQQQAHVEVEVAQLHQTDALRGEHTQPLSRQHAAARWRRRWDFILAISMCSLRWGIRCTLCSCGKISFLLCRKKKEALILGLKSVDGGMLKVSVSAVGSYSTLLIRDWL